MDITAKKQKAKAKTPKKPYPDFPLSPHASGAWQKKIKGKLHYIGRWGSRKNGVVQQLPGDEWWKPALEQWEAERDARYTGREIRTATGELTVMDLANQFMDAKRKTFEAGEIKHRTYKEYLETCTYLLKHLGKHRAVTELCSRDFENLRSTMAAQWGPTRLGNMVVRTKSVFKYACDSELIDRPINLTQFKKPSTRIMRQHRASQPKEQRAFEPAEIQLLLKYATPVLKAMILLSVNCGFGPADSGTLCKEHLDLKTGWINFPRGKTGVSRRIPIWPETIAAIKEAMSPDRTDLVFVTARGKPWWTESNNTMISGAIRTLMQDVDVWVSGRGLYVGRHMCETAGGECMDQVAVNEVMGHVDGSMAGVYRESISDERLIAVTDTIHAWLYGSTKAKSKTTKRASKKRGQR